MYAYEIKVNDVNETNENNTDTNTATNSNANNATANTTENTNTTDSTQQLILKKYFYSVVLLKNIPILYEKLNFIKHHIRKIADSYILTQTIASEIHTTRQAFNQIKQYIHSPINSI